ncbi:MAG: sulfatase [Candidatus Hydrogenedentota bacterium]
MASEQTRRDFMKLSGAAALGAGMAGAPRTFAQQAATATASGKHRNMVFILIDDQRFDALGFVNDFFDTPNLDKLAAGGTFFENAFVTTSLCSPSRATTLTGQYAHQHGVLDNSTRLDPDTPTFPKLLQEAGYKTAFCGKWHMGGSSDEPRPGFDRWVSFRGQGVYYDPTFNIDGERVRREGYVTDLITDYAEDFLRQERDNPFFLYMSHKAVHDDFSPAKRHEGDYADREYPYPSTMADTEENYAGKPEWVREQRDSWHGVDGMYNEQVDFDGFVKRYAEALKAVDDSVGRIVETLRETGQLDDTLIVFTSDNGFQFGEHGLIDKRTFYEASIRVPLIVHCPNLVPAGARREEMILNLDHCPTILEAAGLPIPETVQGLSFAGMLDGGEIPWRTEWLYEYFWERAFPQTPTVLGVRTDRYKLMHFHGVWDKYELYDIIEDPHETKNLLAPYLQTTEAGPLDALILRTAKDPEREIFKTLRDKLFKLLKDTGAAREPNWVP